MVKKLRVPNGIVFVHDINHPDLNIPEYEDGFMTLSNPSCISVRTIHEVDGEASLTLSDHFSDSDLEGYHHPFSGILETPSRELCLTTSEGKVLFNLPTDSETSKVSIWMDNVEHPESILICAQKQ